MEQNFNDYMIKRVKTKHNKLKYKKALDGESEREEIDCC